VTSLVLAASVFVGIHICVAGTRLRGLIVARIGEDRFRGVFSLASLVSLAWMSRAYSQAPEIALWSPPGVLRWPALVLVLLAFVLAVLGITTPSPTATVGERLLAQAEPACGVLRITRHPFLCGVALWAGVHLGMTGDAASTVLFGALLLLAVLGPRSIDAKRRRRFGSDWQRFLALTSTVPFVAIAQRRNRFAVGELGWWRIALGVVLGGVAVAAHSWLFGVSPLPV
jgi:uncharacterized membrane protein